jgi:hypothetical protein
MVFLLSHYFASRDSTPGPILHQYIGTVTTELGTNDLITQKVYFSRLMRVYVGLIMLAACTYSNQGFLASYWSGGFGRFLRLSGLASHIGWRIVQILRQRRRKTINTAPTTQSTFINEQLHSTCD